ncbi:MAG TPA: phosphatase PAP2 family protein [Kiloniellales bacterium]
MSTVVLSQRSASRAGGVLRVLTAHRWFIALVSVYAVCGLVAVHVYDLPDKMSLSLYSLVNLELMLGFAGGWVLCYPVYVMLVHRPARLTRYLIDDLRMNYLTVERLVGALVVAVFLPSFLSVFTGFKTMISVTNPYHWDATFAAWDRWLHFGWHPWEILHPLLAFPWLTSAVNIVYNCWLVVLYLVLFWQAFSTRDLRLRMQFLLSFVATWILLGSLLATLFSSGGPVYYGRLTGLPDPYVPLLDYLQAAGEVGVVWVLKIQDSLWESHMTGTYDFGSGISAMPSIHVSAAVLFVLVGWRVDRRLGIAFTLFAAVIMIGSVHLAWHYAIDGYLAAVLTLLIWWVCGWWVCRDESLSSE